MKLPSVSNSAEATHEQHRDVGNLIGGVTILARQGGRSRLRQGAPVLDGSEVVDVTAGQGCPLLTAKPKWFGSASAVRF